MQNKVVLVTGAASGIGRRIAEVFVREGAIAVITDLDSKKAKATAEEMTAHGGKAMSVGMDVTQEAEVDRGVAQVIEKHGGIDVLISNAGIQHIDLVDKLKFIDWKKTMAVHLDGAFLTTRACLRSMYANGRGGSIIYIGSVHSKEASALKAPADLAIMLNRGRSSQCIIKRNQAIMFIRCTWIANPQLLRVVKFGDFLKH